LLAQEETMQEDRPWDRWHSFDDPDHPNPNIDDQVRVVYMALPSRLPDAPHEEEWDGTWSGVISEIPESRYLRWRHLDRESAELWQESRRQIEDRHGN
jgi:hypothetical protein